MKRYPLSLLALSAAALALGSCSLFDNLRGSTEPEQSSSEYYYSFPEPSIPSVDTTPIYSCNFYGYDGEALWHCDVREGEDATYEGPEPARPEWEGASYRFTGWDKPLKNIRQATDFLPLFEESIKSYTVTFVAKNAQGQDFVAQRTTVPFQGQVSYQGDTNLLSYSLDGVDYSFSSWGVDLEAYRVTGDVTFTANYVPSTEGLSYNPWSIFDPETQTAELGYEVSGASVSAAYVQIPAIHNGLPVRRVASNAFAGNGNIVSVTLPNTIRSIGDSAFAGMVSLAQVNMEQGIEEIGPYAFQDTIAMETIVLKKGLKRLGAYAFRNSGIVTLALPTNMEAVGERAFESCPNLKELDLTKVEIDLSVGFFSSCPSLKTVELNAAMQTIPEALFFNCANLEQVVLPTYLKSIGERAFSSCPKLNHVVVPATVRSLGSEAFSHCPSLSDITFEGEGLETVGPRGFFNDAALTSIALPSSVTDIQEGAFLSTSLQEVSLGDNLTHLGYGAFEATPLYEDQSHYRDGMYYLFSDSGESAYVYRSSEATFVRLREETKLFVDGLSFTMLTLQVPQSLCDDLSFLFNISLSELILEGESAYRIEDGCIYEESTLVRCFNARARKIALPASVRIIDKNAFAGLYNLEVVTLNEGLERIERQAFSDCGVKLLAIPSTVNYIDSSLFAGVQSKYLLLPEDLSPVFSQGRQGIAVYDHFSGIQGEQEGFSYFIADGKAILYAYSWMDYDVRFPSAITIDEVSYDVAELAPFFSWNNTRDITERVFLPEKLEVLGAYAMGELSNDKLLEVSVPKTIRSIGQWGLLIGSAEVVLPRELTKLSHQSVVGNARGKIYSELEAMPSGEPYEYDAGFSSGAKLYWYSDTPKAGAWHYTGSGEDQKPTAW